MEEIKNTVRWLQAEYAAFWGLAAVLFVLYEAGWLEEGWLVGRPRLEYAMETMAILLTLGLVPLSLKGFYRVLSRRIRPLPLLEALKAYHAWSLVRLAALLLVVCGNLWLYYATLDTIGGLCALIGLAASLFCVPGHRRVEDELNRTEP